VRPCITGTGIYVPPQTVSNEELVLCFNEFVQRHNARHRAQIEAGEIAPLAESSADFIAKASGIRTRHVLDKSGILDPDRMRPRLPAREDNELSLQAEMCIHAARQALASANRHASDVDCVVVACCNMQRPYPAIAIEVQHALGIGGYAYDMSVACSSATFAFKAVSDAIRCGSIRCALVLNPEIMSAQLDFRDRDSHFIFGDVCTATVVENLATSAAPAPFEILDIRLWTRFSNNIRANVGFLNAAEEPPRSYRDQQFHQQGQRVFKEVVPAVIREIGEQLTAYGVGPEQLRRLWLHQANVKMNRMVAQKLLQREPQPDDCPTALDGSGNIASAGSVFVFHEHRADLRPGDLGILCSFGAGYSIGSILLERRPSTIAVGTAASERTRASKRPEIYLAGGAETLGAEAPTNVMTT
jgi:beta-ketodecanoyl-[acyl-carrier-protein] synthase